MLWNVDASHIVLFYCDAAQCVLSGKVQPSMKDKSYDIQVNDSVSFIVLHYISSFISVK
jgi:hypothetical protein